MKFTGDFETATWLENETFVWAWAVCEIGSEKLTFGNSIDSFFEFCYSTKNPEILFIFLFIKKLVCKYRTKLLQFLQNSKSKLLLNRTNPNLRRIAIQHSLIKNKIKSSYFTTENFLHQLFRKKLYNFGKTCVILRKIDTIDEE
mgnify:CR=1 FL=1